MLRSMRSAGVRYIVWAFVAVAFVVVFLLLDTSGLLGGGQLTPATTVASVDGRDILYNDWINLSQQLSQQEQQRLGRGLTLDEQRQVEDQAFEQMVNDILLRQEYERRGITVTDEEIRQYAAFAPPPWLAQSPDLYTEGQFDREKYQRLLSSPVARQQGLLYEIERWYRTELPKQKLFEQIARGVYITDSRLWRIWQDEHDSASVSFVALRPERIADSAITVSDEAVTEYYEANSEDFERQGRAVVSLLIIPRYVSAEDSAASRQKALALREEIVSGTTSFEDVARRESADSASATEGGDLGEGARGRFVDPFEEAALGLPIGEVSQPVETRFGFHLIRVDERRGDTLSLHHILVPIQQSDSSAMRMAQRADSLVALVGPGDPASAFDKAATVLGLGVGRAVALEGEPLVMAGRYVPSVSAWAFGGAAVGEASELFDGPGGYYLARLDTLVEGGVPELEEVRGDVRRSLLREAKIDSLVPVAAAVAAAAAGSSLEAAASERGLAVERTEMFNRTGFVPGIGRLNEAIGAAFGVPVGAVSEPVATGDAVYVLRVEQRKEADRAAWEAQKDTQRAELMQRLRQQRVQEYVLNLRRAADIDDRRDDIAAIARRTAI
ncbi:MAG: peptidyl-prolyl cis-trans isomerase [Gemmatimonadaceae bacterium]